MQKDEGVGGGGDDRKDERREGRMLTKTCRFCNGFHGRQILGNVSVVVPLSKQVRCGKGMVIFIQRGQGHGGADVYQRWHVCIACIRLMKCTKMHVATHVFIYRI